MPKRASRKGKGTSGDIKVKKYRRLYGDNYKLYIFEWRGGPNKGATLDAVPANDLKTAFSRMLVDLYGMQHFAWLTIMKKARKKGVLSKIIKIRILEQDKPLTYRPIEKP